MNPKRKFESDAFFDTDDLSYVSYLMSTELQEQRPVSKDGHIFLCYTDVTFNSLL